jgi:glutamate synthase (NADPH/NADH) small chain
MGKVTGFIEEGREFPSRRPVEERVHDWKEVYNDWPDKDARTQASRCMDCGVPFCNYGCPLGNLIPDWNDLVYRGEWEKAIAQLHSTNNFPEFTGRICPAPCEPACTLAINQDPITIEMIEKKISDKAWDSGHIKPEPPEQRTGKHVAVIGSGPAGLAAAQQLNRVGHQVTVFERSEYLGGLLALGIPDFKLEKEVVERRLDQMRAEHVEFRVSTNVGEDISVAQLKADFDSIILTGGSTVPRDLPVPGRDLNGIHFAMDFLTQQNRRGKGQEFSPEETITAEAKNVIIIGGGDTGADCLGTSHRQGATSTTQIEILDRPIDPLAPEQRQLDNPQFIWPEYPMVFRVTAAHEEGGKRDFDVMTTEFVGDEDGNVRELKAVRIEWKTQGTGLRPDPMPVEGSEFTLKADLVLLAMGFLHPQHNGLLDNLGVEYDMRGNVKIDENMMTSEVGVFSAGDMQRGQSLVVHAIAGGRAVARFADEQMMGSSKLPGVKRYFRDLTTV